VVALRRPGRIPDEPLAYLYAIAWRVVANHHRRERRRPIPLTAAHEPQTVDAYAEINLRSDLREALERIPARQAEAIRLVAFESLSASEAAVVLRCSPAAFRVVLSRARRRLDELLGGELDEGP
jgi:RNA polymerase sigma-70 factor (ECF subfamily)